MSTVRHRRRARRGFAGPVPAGLVRAGVVLAGLVLGAGAALSAAPSAAPAVAPVSPRADGTGAPRETPAACLAHPGAELAGRTLDAERLPAGLAATAAWSITVNDEELAFLRLPCADLRGAVLRSEGLTELVLTGADLTGADLSGLALGQTRFADTVVADTRFAGAELGQAVFAGMDLSGIDFSHASLAQADLSGADLRGADLSGADLAQAQLGGADLTGADLTDADLGQASLDGADLTGVRAAGAAFTQVSNLDGASLSGAMLAGASLGQSSLRGADLTDADLTGARLIQADLTDADLTGASIAGADWTQAGTLGAVGAALSGQFPLDAMVLACVLVIALFVLRRPLRTGSGRLPAIAVLAVLAAALAAQLLLAAPFAHELDPRMLGKLAGPLLVVGCFVGAIVSMVHEDAAPGWRSAAGLAVLLAGVSLLLAAGLAAIQFPVLGGEPFQQSCRGAGCLGGASRGATGALLGGLTAALGLLLLGSGRRNSLVRHKLERSASIEEDG
ncbi:pentapeptide repeat-containing protein [Leucobacter allii]|uniref:pentapeptide repeat-containing protein n=1 Tax=Leucobacter allii TaxID=2932247 RepID=UPI001FD390B6|nr:pentapeptide repeat-containing protein [Leucobacter allii]UOR01671.1 pentapeptide repeat-containing protein [Leucobacter allii]